MEVVNTRDRGVSEKDWNMERKTQSFAKIPKAGDINYGMIAHGNDKGRNTVIRDVITTDTMVTELS